VHVRILLFLLCAGCSDNEPAGGVDLGVVTDLAVVPDLAVVLQAGALCDDGIGGKLGTCAAGLKCCRMPCDMAAGTCIDDGAQCQPQPPPPGYFSCM
jgi:hypothetical protein